MRVTDILSESKNNTQIDELNLGKAIGKVAKGVATGAGAVAGGVAGAGKAFMKGFRGGKAFVSGETPTPNKGDYGQLSSDNSKIWNKKTQQWEPFDQAGSTTGATTTGATSATTPSSSGTNPTGAGNVTMASIKSSIAKLPKNQRARIRRLAAAKAGI